MTQHPDRARHTFFCPKCRQDFERSEPGRCETCHLPLAPSGYCPKCRGYWRLRVGQMCPEHGIPLRDESAQADQQLEDEARAVDPGLDPVVVYEGESLDCMLAHAALTDAGLEAQLDDPKTDPLLPKLDASQPAVARVLVPRRHAQKALDVIREFERDADAE